MADKNKIKLVIFLSVVSLVISTAQCKKSFDSESFSPSTAPTISGVSANGGGSMYCSISGGCTLTIVGTNFTSKSVPYVGTYKCLNPVISNNNTQIDCTVGPGQNGVYQVSVKNSDKQPSLLAPTMSAASADFTYASFLYFGSQETPGKVYGYAQNPITGGLISIVGSPFSISGHNGTYGVTIHPNNRYLYSANVSTATISAYSISPTTGALTSLGTPVAAGSGVNGLFFHPTGNFLYATNQSSDGTLTQISGSPFATTGASSINGVVVSSDGKFLYAASMGGNGGVVGYTIDQTTGALTLIAGSPFKNTLGGDTTNPGDGITIHPNHLWLYMGLVGLKKMSGWTIDQNTGVLTPIAAPILNNSTTGYTDNGGSASTVSDDGRFLYGTAFSTTASDPKKVIVYNIDPTTGALTRASEATTGGGPNDIRLDTTGNFAYTCNSLNPPSISAFSVDKNGAGSLTALSPANYAVSAPSSGPGIMVMQKSSQ
jgi:6-phosphogluconolactonase